MTSKLIILCGLLAFSAAVFAATATDANTPAAIASAISQDPALVASVKASVLQKISLPLAPRLVRDISKTQVLDVCEINGIVCSTAGQMAAH
ncbi:MAG: hypothetical protein ACHQAZ_08045 [Gammaproteobacteria bacterium]|jgi:hypothetical protein|nr:hypothetical protein [Gammaproteobacteria bacterium]